MRLPRVIPFSLLPILPPKIVGGLGSVQVEKEISKGVDSGFSITDNPPPKTTEVCVFEKLRKRWERRRERGLYRRMSRELNRSLRVRRPLSLVLWRRR